MLWDWLKPGRTAIYLPLISKAVPANSVSGTMPINSINGGIFWCQLTKPEFYLWWYQNCYDLTMYSQMNTLGKRQHQLTNFILRKNRNIFRFPFLYMLLNSHFLLYALLLSTVIIWKNTQSTKGIWKKHKVNCWVESWILDKVILEFLLY